MVQDLSQMSQVLHASSWVTDDTFLLTGKDFFSGLHIRQDVLYSSSRSSRGRALEHQCRKGCARPEILIHIVQVCDATHGISRHDTIASYIKHSAKQQEWLVQVKPIVHHQG